ncbi:MAG: hypothetical protein Q4C06_05195, partial [Bacillota bacterium]|nr:hypothetical protein [Bacillota bacterium]
MQNDMWERADFSVFDEYIFRDEIHKIGKALEEGEEAVVEAELQKRETLFTEDEAHKLCSVAIQNGCSKRIFSALLEKCPPLETFRFRFSCDFVYAARVDLAGYAAMFDRGKLLEAMLEQGLELKKQSGWCTVLEAALEAASIDCVMLLLHQEEIEIPITKELCYIWGNVGMAYGSDICYAAVASKIFGYEVDLNVEEVPLLPNMKVYQAVACCNWPLFRRICREIGKDALESRGIGHLLGTILKESDDPMEDMDILLSLHPKALKNELVRYCLVVSALRAKDVVDERLKKWLNQMPGGMVVMNVSRVFEEEDVMNLQTLILLRWQERIGTRLIPALSRDKPFPEMNGIF